MAGAALGLHTLLAGGTRLVALAAAGDDRNPATSARVVPPNTERGVHTGAVGTVAIFGANPVGHAEDIGGRASLIIGARWTGLGLGRLTVGVGPVVGVESGARPASRVGVNS